MKKKIIGRKDGHVCQTFGIHRKIHLVPEREVIWLRTHTASNRQIWTRIESSMKAGTFLLCSSLEKRLKHRCSKTFIEGREGGK